MTQPSVFFSNGAIPKTSGRRPCHLLLPILILLASPLVQAQPVVSAGGVLNAASYALPGLQNSPIAQGAMFVVFGQRLGPAALQQVQSFPLPAQLGGTSIKVAGGGVTADAIMIYTSAGQVAAILPSRVPPGDADLTLTYNGQASAPVRIRVAPSSLGVFTRNQAGSGPGIVQNYVSATEQPVNALTEVARPGSIMILWATGLGPVDFDEAVPPQARNLDVNLEVFVAGKSAHVLYKGRSSQFPGIDQINFELPGDAPEGCYVPVALRAGGVVSNFTTVSIAASGRSCSDDNSFSAADLETARSTGGLRMNRILLSKFAVQNFVPGVYDTAESKISRYEYPGLLRFVSVGPYSLPYGSCTTVASGLRAGQIFDIQENPNSGGSQPIGGAPLTLSGPLGSRHFGDGSDIGLGGGIPNFTSQFGPEYLVPGAYTLDNGNGGSGIGPYKATLTLPATPVWTNPSDFTTIARTGDITVTWTGPDLDKQYVLFTGLSNNTGIAGKFVCAERASAGRLTVPAMVVSTLPASGTVTVAGQTVPLAWLQLQFLSLPAQNRINVTGVDTGYFGYSLSTVRIVAVQ
jgi:uncharacterized protein (TIGR03437 family)